MAEQLASIFGTEKDRVNCPFYFKIGACHAVTETAAPVSIPVPASSPPWPPPPLRHVRTRGLQTWMVTPGTKSVQERSRSTSSFPATRCWNFVKAWSVVQQCAVTIL